jgi:hypothetical protein
VDTRDIPGTYWTSGERSEDYFEWRAKKLPFDENEINWNDGDQSKKYDNCVLVRIDESPKYTGLSTYHCEASSLFLCEVIKILRFVLNKEISKNNFFQMSREERDGLLAQKDCAELWKITAGKTFKIF